MSCLESSLDNVQELERAGYAPRRGHEAIARWITASTSRIAASELRHDQQSIDRLSVVTNAGR